MAGLCCLISVCQNDTNTNDILDTKVKVNINQGARVFRFCVEGANKLALIPVTWRDEVV
jgi:hypothetical protein